MDGSATAFFEPRIHPILNGLKVLKEFLRIELILDQNVYKFIVSYIKQN